MKKTALIAMVVLLFSSTIASAETSKLEDLVNSSAAYDGQLVTVQGEVVGDVMIRGDYAWINITDEGVAIGIYAPAELVRELVPGRFNTRGDQVRITGFFYRSCPEHGGDMDIHLTTVRVVQQHHSVEHALQRWKFTLAGILALGYGAILTEKYLRKRRQPNV